MEKSKRPFSYGFLDESGEPGAAKHSNDYLIASLIIFDSYERMISGSKLVDELRKELSLPADYEFHRSKNAAKVKESFLNLITEMDFGFVTIAIHKKRTRESANYEALGEALLAEIRSPYLPIRITMDSNPSFYKELAIRTKVARRRRDIYVRQAKSHTDNMLQVADYIANISAQWVKEKPHGAESYNRVAKKCQKFILL